MPKRKEKVLKALDVSRLESPGTHFIGEPAGLALQITPTGAKSWVLRARIGGKRREMGLGAYRDGGVSLAKAQEKAVELRDMIRRGLDPIEEAKAARSALAADRAAAITFKEAALAYISAKESEWKNAKHAAQWGSTLETYAYPIVGRLLVRDVEQSHVMRILEPIWSEKTETASRLRGRIESVLSWATVRGYRQGDNPARWRGHLDKLLAKPSKVSKVEHHAALPHGEIGAFMAALRQQQGIGAAALEFAILTATRSGEARGAQWVEFDLDAGTWTIPAGRMKADKEHQIPLSDAALAVLERMKQHGTAGLVFPGAKEGKPLSDMSLTAVLKRMGRRDLTAHGFRSTFRDWAGETTNHPREIIEHALAHKLKDKAEAAYARGTLFEKRRRLMRDWAKACDKVQRAATVTRINAKGS